MRITVDLSRFRRSLLALPVVIGALVASPAVAPAQGIIQRPADAAADLQKFLPQIPSIPWLEARFAAAQKSASPLPNAGSVSAWLLTPRAPASWPYSHTQAALADTGTVGM